MNAMKADFKVGALDPYNLMIDTGRPGGVWSAEYFETEAAVIARLLATQPRYVDRTSFRALSFFDGANVSFSASMAWLNHTEAAADASRAAAYRSLVGILPASTGAASMIRIETLVAPNSEQIVDFLLAMRSLAASLAAEPVVRAFRTNGYVLGGYSTSYDVQQLLYSLAGLEVGIIIAIVVVIVGSSFRSLLIAVRLIVSLGLSLLWTYGILVLVYQHGAAQDAFARLTPLILQADGVYWIIPFMRSACVRVCVSA